MLDIHNLQLSDLDQTLNPVHDEYLSGLKKAWYHDPQQSIDHDAFVDKASAWFKSTKINDLRGWEKFPCVIS